MSILVYCVTNSAAGVGISRLDGVGARPVSVVTCDGLGAAVTDSTDIDVTTETANIITYNRVITFFHHMVTVIPLRYGSSCRDVDELREHLRDRSAFYRSLLRKLDGCVEMGIRILVPPEANTEPNDDTGGLIAPEAPGRQFLERRRAYYSRENRMTETHVSLIAECREAFAGLFVSCREEQPSSIRPLLSLYFRVPRDSVVLFRKTFRRLNADYSSRLMMSGPWPPYNFVCSETG